jgi:nucleoid-associated protein YgaU
MDDLSSSPPESDGTFGAGDRQGSHDPDDVGAGIIAAMTDRVSPGVDGSPACPFIAYEDERDERSSSPDHRHRCFAEVTPAPRALAHQEAYCLSSAFPVCPTFQDWARREAAQARGAGGAGATSPGRAARSVIAAAPVQTSAFDDDEPADDAAAAPVSPSDDAADHETPDEVDDEHLWSGSLPDSEPIIHRNPPRDWAAPPPWAPGAGNAGQGSGGRPRATDDIAAELLSGRGPAQGLAGSAADRLAGGTPPSPRGAAPRVTDRQPRADRSSPPSDELAGLVAPAAIAAAGRAPIPRPPTGSHRTTAAAGRRPTVSSTRERAHDDPDHDGPSWERARRYEAYPTIKTRTGLPNIPTVALLVGALAIAALALFFLPALLGLGGGASESPSPTASVGASPSTSASPKVTAIPSPAGDTYTIKKGDTLLKIAKKFGVTVDQLLAANKQIKDPNKIAVGDVINLPKSATPSSINDATPKPSPS